MECNFSVYEHKYVWHGVVRYLFNAVSLLAKLQHYHDKDYLTSPLCIARIKDYHLTCKIIIFTFKHLNTVVHLLFVECSDKYLFFIYFYIIILKNYEICPDFSLLWLFSWLLTLSFHSNSPLRSTQFITRPLLLRFIWKSNLQKCELCHMPIMKLRAPNFWNFARISKCTET